MDQFILGEILAFVIGFLVFYAIFRKREKINGTAFMENLGVHHNDNNNNLTRSSSESNGHCSPGTASRNTDVIVVGAGVAGSALAYTLAKVTHNLSLSHTQNFGVTYLPMLCL